MARVGVRIGLLGTEMDILSRSQESKQIAQNCGLRRRPQARIENGIGMKQAYIVPLERGISTVIFPHILNSIRRPNYLGWTFLTLRRPHCASVPSQPTLQNLSSQLSIQITQEPAMWMAQLQQRIGYVTTG